MSKKKKIEHNKKAISKMRATQQKKNKHNGKRFW